MKEWNFNRHWIYIAVLFLLFAGIGCGNEGAATTNKKNILQESETDSTNKGNDAAALVDAGQDTAALDSVQPADQESAASDPVQPADQQSAPSTLQLVMVGDVLLHTPVSDSGRLEDGSYNYDHLFANVKDLVSEADIAIANQEVILGGTKLGLSGYPCFNGAYEVGDALVNSGFDVILHATNHALDKGEKGVRNCLSFWKEKYPQIYVAGINDSKEAQEQQLVIVEKNKIKVAILNYTYGTNGIAMPSDAPYLVNLIDKEKIRQDVELARKQADFIVVCPHWGVEYRHTEGTEQEELAKYLADLGVDLIIGTHPHVIEPVKWVEGEKGGRTLVYYSLGNFVNATSGTGDGVADRMLGAMAKVTLQRTSAETDDTAGTVEISDYTAIPLVSHLKTGLQQITVYPLEEYNKALAGENEIIVQDSNFSLEYLEAVWNEVMGE